MKETAEAVGEGERGCRTDAAVQNAFGPRETEPQFLAALDRRSDPRLGLNSYRFPFVSRS